MSETNKTLSLFNNSPYETEFTARVMEVGESVIALDKTLFYPTGGGQPGDTGHLLMPDGTSLLVKGTFRTPQNKDLIWHEVGAHAEKIEAGIAIAGSINWERHYGHMKMHTCLHLLCAIVRAPVTGCSISYDKGRLDFDLPEASLDKEVLTAQLNELINASHEVTIHHVPAGDYHRRQGLNQGRSLAYMDATDAIRLVNISGVDVQPCGGTHVRNTSEIGTIVCAKIEKKSRYNRRVTIRFA